MPCHTYYTPMEAAGFLELSPVTLACWRSRGVGPAFLKLSDSPTGRVLYHVRDLKKWHGKPKRRLGDQRSIARKIEEGHLPLGWPVAKAGN